MLKITEKITRYDIENLNDEDYSILRGLFYKPGYRSLPPVYFAYKVLKKEDLLDIYQISNEDLDELLAKNK